MKKYLSTSLKILVSLGLITYLFWRMDLQQVQKALYHANYLYLLPAALLFLAAMTNSALKWYILLRAQRIAVPFHAVLSYTYVGFFFNNFLPANVGGDVMRGYGLARYIERTAEAAISVIVDRIVGLVAFMVCAAVSAAVAILFMEHTELQGVEVAAMTALGLTVGGFAAMLSRRIRAQLGKAFLWRPLVPLSSFYQRTSQALDAYRYSYSALAAAFCTSLFTLILANLTDYLIAQSLGGGVALIYIFIFNPIIAFVLLVPVSIGGLGVTQAVYPFFYGLVGVPASLAFSISLLKQLIIYITSLLGGMLWWRGKAGAGETAQRAVEVSGT
ncbi:MAG: flippase-like domain-containing protein [Anaerolineae bacterium]|nr:flippase-like domain-containing protein [Anaerolineae bacterium]MDW8071762.1 lysylphosphatidylglycerol synthase transmembrane domain-containing protein [Anaerolineae bacterium]